MGSVVEKWREGWQFDRAEWRALLYQSGFTASNHPYSEAPDTGPGNLNSGIVPASSNSSREMIAPCFVGFSCLYRDGIANKNYEAISTNYKAINWVNSKIECDISQNARPPG